MTKIVWCSRHPMNEDQIEDLKDILECDDLEIETKNLLWKATKDPLKDIDENAIIWKNLNDTADVIVGVFPPVAIEALNIIKTYKLILSPVSEQCIQDRSESGKTISFKHVRYSVIEWDN